MVEREFKITTFNIYKDQLERLGALGLKQKKSQIVRELLDSHLNPDIPDHIKTRIDEYVALKDEAMKDLLITFGGVTDDFAVRFSHMLYRGTYILIIPPAAKKYLEEWVTKLVRE